MVKNIDNITQLPQTGATTMGVMLVGAFAIILVATASGFAAYESATRTWATVRPSPDFSESSPASKAKVRGSQEPGSCGLFSCQPHDPSLPQIRNSHMNHKG